MLRWYRAGRENARRIDQQLLIADPASINTPFAIAVLRSNFRAGRPVVRS
jgi:hypothetical protein